MDNYAKLMFNCNELPKDVEHSNAYFRRFLIIPFTQTISEAEQDKSLAGKIISLELSGIFNWVLEGLERLTQQGVFTESEEVNKALLDFKQESDSVFQFIEDCGYEKSFDKVSRLLWLYKEYDEFCRNNGFKALNVRNFRKRLEGLDIIIKRVANGNTVYLTRKQGVLVHYEDVGESEMPF